MTLKFWLLAFITAFIVFPEGQNTDFPHAVARRGCTQEDAPALEIYLTSKPHDSNAQPQKPYLRIEVGGRNWQALVGKDLELLPLSRRGSDRAKPLVRAELNLPTQSDTVWLEGNMKLVNAEAEKEVTGSYDFTGPGECKWKGEFKAVWTKGGGGCG